MQDMNLNKHRKNNGMNSVLFIEHIEKVKRLPEADRLRFEADSKTVTYWSFNSARKFSNENFSF